MVDRVVLDPLWTKLDALIADADVVVDRPKGSRHPRYEHIIYPLDYGHLLGTTGNDGDPVDVWLGSTADRFLNAVICTVDLAKKDAEIKFLLGCTAEDKQIILRFHSDDQAGALLVERG